MKIRDISVRNYKKFVVQKTLSFCNSEGEVNDMTLLIGNNGSGKTSILQAMVALMAPLVRDRFDASAINWNGYEYRLLQTGQLPVDIRASISFDERELKAAQNYAKQLKDKGVPLTAMPSDKRQVSLSFDYEHCKTNVSGGAGSLSQFYGYQYAKQLAAYTVDKSKLFEEAGNIFWYTDQRNSFDTNTLFDTENELNQIDSIRTFLANAYSFHLAIEQKKRALRPGEFDYYEKIAHLYHRVFHDRSFVGASPRFDVYEKSQAPDFFLSDGEHQYEISEMSAGERAIFPVLMDFARYNINHSIIIIDEIELHLHAPLQQAFVRALPKLGHNNQFILTSHSDNVVVMFDESENQIIRLE
ncbi:MAG: AAA family ATPase [Bacteroidales bacterium]|jgi:energy-coupling factor transporter ATP-binding protein EcfA2|nr:AAA family ATPase [Bacteroidales bacterium]